MRKQGTVLCPLLNALPADERQRRMEEDPVIGACVAAVEGAGALTEAAAKKRAAYDRICADVDLASAMPA